MAKKDFENMENKDRRGKDDQGSSGINETRKDDDSLEANVKTRVKNANASGLGSIGRSEEKETDRNLNGKEDKM